MRLSHLGFILNAMLLVAGVSGNCRAAERDTVPCFSVWEDSFSAARDWENPYTQVDFQATFTHQPSGKTMVVEGFWDGGRTWRLRFAPPRQGEWRFVTASKDAGLDGRQGSLLATRGKGHGFVMTARGEPRFVYSDGAPFYYAATSLSCFCGLSGISLTGPGGRTGAASSRWPAFQKIVDRRAAQGFTVLYACGDLFCKPFFNQKLQVNEGGPPFFDYDPTRLNPAFFQWVDKRVAYANARGLAVTLGLGWPDQNILRLGKDNLRRAWRYVVARYSAYNVLWELFGEFEEFGRDAVPLAREFGELTRRCDPYDHPTSTHSVDTCNELAEDDWLDYIVHQNRNYELITQDLRFGKPVVNAEFYYENVLDRPVGWSHIVRDINLIRRGAWQITTRGGRFVYEIWGIDRDLDHLLETEGTRQVMYLHRLMRSLPYWALSPRPDLADGVPTVLSDGKGYLVAYLLEGGTLRLNLSGFASPLRVRWYDPRLGKFYRGPLSSAGRQRFSAPDLRDWVLVVDPRPQGYSDTQLPRAPAGAGHPDLGPLLRELPLVEYDFAHPGATVKNQGSLGSALDLVISDPGAVQWLTAQQARAAVGSRAAGLRGGLRLVRPVTVRTQGPASELVKRAKAAGKLLVQAVFEPADLSQQGPARLVSLSRDPSRRDFTLGQHRAKLEVRLRTSLEFTNPNGLPAWMSSDTPLGPRPHLVSVTFYYDGTTRYLWLQGRPHALIEGMPAGLKDWEPMPLVLGNEADGSRPWLGTLYRVTIRVPQQATSKTR